jgi:hypothetical protein
LVSFCSFISSVRISSCTIWSSAEVTSSQMMISGSGGRARAMEMRCFWPPDSFTGQRSI